ncbi:MAG: zinc ribbon domain-containing protein [Anaerolineales bacterium]|nr:zinc ribbon domain-containing protein [Anaerolineales bacterium]
MSNHQPPTICSICSKSNPPGSVYCSACGAELQQTPIQAAETEKPPRPCPNCGKTNLPASLFCSSCGQKLSPDPVSSQDSASINDLCPHCGWNNLPGSQYCSNCGENLSVRSLSASAPADKRGQQQEKPSFPRKHRKLGCGGSFVILVVVLLLLVGGSGALYYYTDEGEFIISKIFATELPEFLIELKSSKNEAEALASLEPQWLPYDPMESHQQIEVFDFIEEIRSNATYHEEVADSWQVGENNPSIEECNNTYVQCGDSAWSPVAPGDTFDSGCKIKITEDRYCHFLLPDGSLLSAFNNYDAIDEEDEAEIFVGQQDFIFQVNLGIDETRVLQNILQWRSGIYHYLPDEHLPYLVEVGDYLVESMGTGFITGTANGYLRSIHSTLVEVRPFWGTVKVGLNPVYFPQNTSSVTLRAVGDKTPGIESPAFLATDCPFPYIPCGNGCVPRNTRCCSIVDGSYCLLPLRCGENFSGQCTSGLFFSETSNYCCVSSSALADEITLMKRGSNDCPAGKKHCGMLCIPDDQPCCFNSECAGTREVDFEIVDWNWDHPHIFRWMAEAYNAIPYYTEETINTIFRDKLKEVIEAGLEIHYLRYLNVKEVMGSGEDDSSTSSSSDVPVPNMSGAATCPGCFPNFNKSDCGSGWGPYLCEEGGTWNLTEICKQYPGESFCSWPEVQNTLH